MRIPIFILLLVSFFSAVAQTTSVELAQQYYQQGETEKALDMYARLARNANNWPLIHNQYFALLLQTNEYQKATKYIDKLIKTYPANVNYKIDKGRIIYEEKGEDRANSYYKNLANLFSTDPYTARRAAQYYLQLGERDQAVDLLLLTRKRAGNPTLFSIDLANIYRYMNKKQEMVEEYILFANQSTGNIRYVKNSLQATLTEPEDIENLEAYLYKMIQEEPENVVYSELLIWANVQTKNFTSAFIQARALDRRLNQGGKTLMDLGQMALSNGDFSAADKIFSYIAANYTGSQEGTKAELWKINSKEEQAKRAYPHNQETLVELTQLYKDFSQKHPNTMEAYKAGLQVALLNGYFLDKKTEAINELNELINNPRLNDNLKAEAKLTLADIYLLNDEPWESALLYAQVDKTMKETPIGYEAKLKRAKLAYYQGEFDLAQAVLDILKMATSREIANDALDLSVFIKENTVFDSTNVALKAYAALELLEYQNKDDEVLKSVDSLLRVFKGQSLEDDFLMLKAKEQKKKGNFTAAAETYAQVVQQFGYDVLGDKALFLEADIYQNYLKDSARAQELYVQLLRDFPGSVYVAESRKRYRTLRGDFSEVEQKEPSF
ncbi:MAG: hypothetical protein KDC79_00520 [Cyclobacteriaceae bacterium]|nr:hypothetical protein [Cyclobacteriaceae bacterium]